MSAATPISPEEFKNKMKAIAEDPNCDIESSHSDGDWLMMDTLRKLGYGEGVDIFEDMPKWYA